MVAAVRGAVNVLLDEVIAEHLEARVAGPGLGDDERDLGPQDLVSAVRRY